MNIEQIKQELKAELENNKLIAAVGRVTSWLDSPESRMPVSCTVLSVEDSMEHENGIEYSWLYVSKGLRYGAGVALDLSKLRGKGIDNGRGLISSGVVSFMTIYSKLNEVLRRGGSFRNGAVVCYLDASHHDIEDFLDVLPSEIPWAKRAVYIDVDPKSKDYIMNNPLLDKILDKVRDGSVWLAKKVWRAEKGLQFKPANPNDIWQDRLFSQVCMELAIQTNSSCLLSHINLGQCKPEQLEKAAVDTAEFLCKLHAVTGAGRENYYLPPDKDRQIGLGCLGLANFLAREGITYKDFADCLYDSFEVNPERTDYSEKLKEIVGYFRIAFYKASQVARKYNMERALTIAPTASVSYRFKDLDGYVTAPEISPPIANPKTKTSIRDSGNLGTQEVQYPLNVETAAEVGFDTYFKLVKAWQKLMNIDHMGHAISFNVWNTCNCDRKWFKEFVDSPLITTYYRMSTNQESVDKTTVSNLGIDIGLEEEEDFFKPDDNEVDNTFSNFGFSVDRSKLEKNEDVSIGFCNMENGICTGCDD